MADADRCYYCNEIIPEGRQVCPICSEKIINTCDHYSKSEQHSLLYELLIKCGKTGTKDFTQDDIDTAIEFLRQRGINI